MIIPADRITTWQGNVGVVGDIPTGWAIYTTLGPSATVADINNAIAACPPNQVVKLNPGTYNINGRIYFQGKSNCILRGSGSSTVLNCTGNLYGGNIFVEGPNTVYLPQNNPGHVVNWASNFTQGGNQMDLSSVVGLSVGDYFWVDQLNDSAANAAAAVASLSYLVGKDFSYEGCGNCGRSTATRSQQQMFRVASISGNTVTTTTPIQMPNWRITQTPQAWWVGNLSQNVGIEDLRIVGSNSEPWGIYGGNICFTFAANCWVKNVKSENEYRGYTYPISGSSHVVLYVGGFITIRHSHFYGTRSAASSSYGVLLFEGSNCLVEDNIFDKIVAPVILGSGTTGNVIAYNFTTNNYYLDPPSYLAQSFWSHDAHCCMNLFEGNWGTGVRADQFHGTASHQMLFRNRLTGYQDETRTQNRYPVLIDTLNRKWNFVGNVLGTVGKHTAGQIFVMGGSTNANVPNDPYTASSSYRHGNYDTATDSITWDASNADHVIPNSLYLPAKPSWFGNLAWPPFDPGNPTVALTAVPAGYRYINGADPPPANPIIPVDRILTWSGNVGVPGGIPTNRTLYQSLTAANLGNGISDGSAAILNATSSCPSNQYVQLPPGTFLINQRAVRTLNNRNNYTLRGSVDGNGNPTTILKLGAADFAYVGSADYPYPQGGVNITAGATINSSVMSVSNTASFTPGLLCHVTQTNPTWVVGHGQFGPNMTVTCKILSRSTISGAGTVTLDHALPITFVNSPKLVVYPTPPVQGVGFENLVLDCNNTAGVAITFEQALGCWIKNVKVTGSYARQFMLIVFNQGEIRHCYTTGTIFRQAGVGMNHEGIDFYLRSCWNLIEDNICDNGGFPSIIFDDSQGGCVGNAVMYNYIKNVGTATDISGAGISFHGGHAMFNLLEGNIVESGISGDGIHGSHSHTTVFRNWCQARPYNTGGFNVTKIIRALSPDKFANWYNVVGNVLGDSTFPIDSGGLYQAPGSDYAQSTRSIYRLGYPFLGHNGSNGTWGPQAPALPDYTPASYGGNTNIEGDPFNSYPKLDLNVSNLILRHGNYDFFNRAIIWDPAIADHNIPSSLLYASKPAFFGNLAWPPIDPAAAATLAITAIPAGYRFVHGFDPSGGAPPAAAISLDTHSLDFGYVNLGDHSDLFVTITNSGGASSSLTGAASVVAPFSIVSGGSYTALSSGQSQTIFVRYTPAQDAMYNTATMTLTGGNGDAVSLSGRTPFGLVFPSISGQIKAPFVADFANGYVSQPIQTLSTAQSGRAIYKFNVPSAGSYTISAVTLCPDGGSNSFFFAVDAEPDASSNLWDVPVSTAPRTSPLKWYPETSAHVFVLSQGVHTLTILGREQDAKFGQVTVASTAPPPNQPPTAGLSADVTSGVGPLIVSFTITASDPDGSVASGILDFGDGSAPLHIMAPQASSTQPHTYAAVGSQTTYNATWIATDNQGAASAPAARNITISPTPTPPPNQSPVAGMSAVPLSGGSPLVVTFTLTSSDPDDVVASGTIDYGDGSAPEAISTPASSVSRQHSYNTPGTYSASWVVADSHGATGSATPVSITSVAPPPPVISLDVTSLDFGTVDMGQMKTLKVRVTNSGGQTLAGVASASAPYVVETGGSYSLSTGQSQDVFISFTPTAYGATSNATAFFTGAGGASVALHGASSAATGPAGSITAPAQPVIVVTGGSVVFTGAASDPQGLTPITYTWDFRDGTTSTAQSPGSKQFTAAGTYNVTMTARNSLGVADPHPPSVQIRVLDQVDIANIIFINP